MNDLVLNSRWGSRRMQESARHGFHAAGAVGHATRMIMVRMATA